ncbi:Aquaporin AQPAe.a [Frankliniella fusca]|uniref:Aquaporin AQPAe.a n=1 Tax=Frankliniella fusca TaxID=407009 RepID=A0AAE1HRE4_9NEOP|nr:Aquaporin AQPAe.a [Frankliniella fusca]
MDTEKWLLVLRRALGELFATATLVFIGCMGLVGGLSKTPDHFAVAFNFGIAVMAGLIGITPTDRFVTNPSVPAPSCPLCCNSPNPMLTGSQQFWSEFVFSALLSLLACAVWDRRNLDKHDSVSLRFGLGVFAIAYGGVQYSGCSMNPARTFGPAVVWNYWDNHWLYWVAPMLANLVVASFYRIVFPEPRPQPVE